MKTKDFIGRLFELIEEFAAGKYSRFASIIEANPTAVKNYLNGENLPGYEVIERICLKCQVTPNWLIFGWLPKYGGEFPLPAVELRVVDAAAIAGGLTDNDFLIVPILKGGAWKDIDRGITVVNPSTIDGVTVARSSAGVRLVGFRHPDEILLPRIAPDDLLIIDLEAKHYSDGDIALLRIAGKPVVRFLFRGLAIASYHDPDPRPFKKADLLGRVVEVRRIQ